MKMNFEGDTRHEGELRRRHTPWIQTYKTTHAMNTKLEETHAIKTNLEDDTRHEYKVGGDTRH